MILIQIYRIAQCEICHGQWALDPRLEISNPDECQICGSRDWLWGPEPLDSRFIRQGISKKSRKVNPGASSRKRQEQGMNPEKAAEILTIRAKFMENHLPNHPATLPGVQA